MSKTVFEFKEKKNYLVVDGEEYEIPQRTPALEERIREHDARIPEMTEYEANYSLLQILLGDEAVKKIFPDKETTNLDKLAKCAMTTVQLFMSEFQKIRVG